MATNQNLSKTKKGAETKSASAKKTAAAKKAAPAKKTATVAKTASVKKTAPAKTDAAKKAAPAKKAVPAKKTVVAKKTVPAKRSPAKQRVPAAEKKETKPVELLSAGAAGHKTPSAKELDAEIERDNKAYKALLAGNGAEQLQKQSEDDKKKKTLVMYIVIGVIAAVVILAVILCVRGCVSSQTKAAQERRQNCIAQAQKCVEATDYDRALDFLADIIKDNPNDAEVQGLFDKILELKKAEEAANGGTGSGGNYSVKIDTSNLTNAMQQSLDSMKDQLAQQTAENAQRQKEMNDLIAKQQQQEQAEKQQQAEQKAQQEADAKQRAKEDAERKAKEAELAKQDAAFKNLMDKIDDEIKLGEGSLNLADTNGAIRHFEKAKGMLPTSSSDRDKEYSAAKLGEMALALFDASQNATTDPADAEKQEAKAAEYAQDSIAKSSHEGASHYVLGMRAFHKRNYDTAEKELKLAIQEDTGNFMYYYQLGRVQATESKYSDARISFTSAIKYNGNYAPAQYNLGFVQEKLNRDEALASYRKAYSIDSNYEKAYLAAARILARKGNYSDALSEYKEAVRVNPGNANTYKEQGSTYAAAGNNKEAESCYRKALTLLKPGEDDPATYYNLSTVLYNQGKTEEAVAYAKKAYDTKSSALKEVQINSIYNYALICDKTGDYEKAITLYKEVLKVDPANIKSKINLAVIAISENDADTALTLLKSAYAQEPRNFEVNNNLGSAYLLNKDYTDAITSFQAALKIDPKNNTVRTNLAAAYQSALQYDNAKTTYLEVIKYDDQNWDAYVELGKVCLAQQDDANAEKYLRYVQTKRPDWRAEEVTNLMRLATASNQLEK